MRERNRADRWRRRTALIAATAVMFVPQALRASDFEEHLARVDYALKHNPSHAHPMAVRSCRSRRNSAVRYEKMNQHDRAQEALEYCLRVLKVAEPKD